MAVEGCGKFLKFIVFFFNFLVFIGGCGLLGVGIWSLVDAKALGEIGKLLGENMFSTASYILIAVGVILLLLGFLGCCGAWKESKCLLGLFFLILFLMFVVLLAGGILAFVYQDKVKQELEKQMNSTLIEKYDPASKDKEVVAISDAWNVLQEAFKCCGIKGSYNEGNSYAKWVDSTWYKNQKAPKQYVPDSCCNKDAMKGNSTELTKVCNGLTDTTPTGGPPRNAKPAKAGMNPYLYTTGCYNAVNDFVTSKAPILGGIAVGIAVLMLIAMIFSICLCRSIRPNYDQYA